MSENQIIKYINTPFAYTRAQKGLTLLQQNIMVRVSAHLQNYFNKFFRTPELLSSKEDPKPVMTVEDKDNLPPVRIELSELGISSGTYGRARKALRDVLGVTIDVAALSDEGKPIRRVLFLFSEFDIPITEAGTTVRMRIGDDDDDDALSDVKVDRTRGYVDIYLNKDAIFSMFDMNQGYVSHPEEIARVGNVANMPLMYYFIRHKMKNFRVSKVKTTLLELRDYLGAIKRDSDGNIVKVQYAKYNMFKTRIILTALNDIKRVCDNGQIDFYFEMEEIRAHGKKTGDPEFLVFRKVANKEKAKTNYRQASEKRLLTKLMKSYPAIDKEKASVCLKSIPEEMWDDFKNYAYKALPKAVEKPHRWDGTHEEYVVFLMEQWVKQHTTEPGKEKKSEPTQQSLNFDVYEHVEAQDPAQDKYTSEYVKEWKDLMADYAGPLSDVIGRGCVLGKDPVGWLVIEFTKADADVLDASDEWSTIREAFKNKIGQKYGPGIQIKVK